MQELCKHTNPHKRPKLAICLEYKIDFQGGVSSPCRALIAALADRFDIVLVSPDSAEDVRCSSVGSAVRDHIKWIPTEVSKRTSKQLAAELAARNVQLAHFHFGGNFGFGSPIIGKCPIPYIAKKGVPVLSTIHMVVGLLDGYCGPEKPLWFKLLAWPIGWAGKTNVLRHERLEIITSARATGWMRRWYWPCRSKFRLIYQSRLFENTLPKQTFRREAIILYAAHIAPRKGQHILVDAFAQIAQRHPEWKLILCGEAGHPEGDALVRAALNRCQLGDQVRLIGPHPNAPELMGKASIYAQPSFFEGLPLALQEAMLCGCACVATDIPGNNELISDTSTGVLVEKGNVAALAAVLERLITNEGLRKEFGARARLSVLDRGMTAERMVANYIAAYESCLRAN